MKLIKQTALWNREGNADKVYEIDLCETAPGLFVVNFRYGRRGSLLKDGTKTVMPVALAEAEKIFAKLKEEKEKGGYKTTDDYEAAKSMDAVETKPTIIPPLNTKHTFILSRLKEPLDPGTSADRQQEWPLSRIIWRAGQLQVKEAAPLILPQLVKGNPLMQYIASWSLGRCGNTMAIEPLHNIYQSKASAPHVKRKRK